MSQVQLTNTRTTTELVAEMQFRANTVPELYAAAIDFASFMEIYDHNYSEVSEN